MKKIILILWIVLPLVSVAQKEEKKTENKSDTLITKDPLKPGREYWIIHDRKGNMKAQGFMVDGKKDGIWREYNELNGEIIKMAEYEGGILNGASVTFNNSGTVQIDETYVNSKKNGQRTSFGNFGGKMKLFEYYKNDTLDGSRKTFYEDGKVQEEGVYKNGQRNGTTKWFFQNGNPSMEYHYENGSLEGSAQIYYEDGKLKQEGLYKNNNEEGEWREYKDSLLVKKIIYRQGQILREIPVKK